MDRTRMDDLCAAAPLGSPSCQPYGFGDLLGPAACRPTEPITLRDKLACVWKQLLAAPSQISGTVDLRSMTK